MTYPLRRKYRVKASVKRNKSSADRTGNNKRHKIGSAAKKLLKPQPKKALVIDLRTGSRRMLIVEA